MTLRPDSPFDIKLSSGRETRPYGLVLDEGSGALTIGAVAQDDSVYVRNVGKKTGDFDEQRSWKGGRGVEKFNDNAEGFWDSENAWTLTKGHLHNGILWRYAKGLRKATSNFSNSKSWKGLYGTQRGISVSFTPDETGDYDKGQIWLRYRGAVGSENELYFKLHSDSGGSPGSVLQSKPIYVAVYGQDSVSQLITFDWAGSGTETLTAGTTYHITLVGASTSTENEHWEVAVDAAGDDSKISSDGSAWSTPSVSFSMLFRVVDADVKRTFKPFFLDGHMYIVDIKDDGTTASQLYINGDRGQATGGTTTTLVDTAFGCRATAQPDNRFAGAKIRYRRGVVWYVATIDSHTGDTYTFEETMPLAPAAASDYFIYSTEWFTELTGHGLGVVKGEPAIMAGMAYIPQGEASAIRCMSTDFTAAQNHKYRAEAGANPYAHFLRTAHDKSDGAIIWRARPGYGTVAYAKKVAYGTDLAFGTDIDCGDTTYAITGLNEQPGILYVLKENKVGTVSNGSYSELQSGTEDTPDFENGAASLVADKFFYYNWLHSVVRVYGSSHDDIGQDYRSFGLPEGREGNISYMDAYITLPLFAVDADTGISSVLTFDGLGWHEILRGYEAGKRIRMVKVQPCSGGRNRIWTEIGGELVYQELPLKKSSPTQDTGMLYQHEAVVESSIIDMGAASDLPKFIKMLVTTVRHLNTEGMEVYLDYQIDNDCHTTTWTPASVLTESPESKAYLGLSNIKRFTYRLRLNTNDASTPVDIEGVVPNGYARTPLKLIWTLRIKSGGIYQIGSQSAADTSKLWMWLLDNARLPYSVKMESKYLEADNYNVIIHPPRMFPYKPPRPGEAGEAYLTLSLEEV
jgi:hypothetical protein